MAYKTWYAVLKDENDRDFSVGSYDEDEAEEISKRPEYNRDTVLIAETCVCDSGRRFTVHIGMPYWVAKDIVV